jgi:hypothetical protein
MQSLDSVKELLEKNDFATSLDIHQAFHHIRVHPSLHPYLAFFFEG